MVAVTERNYLGDAIKHEYCPPNFCRETGTLITGQNLKLLTLLGKITASKKLTQWAPAATDGSENVAGILINDVDATDADQSCVYLARGPAMLAFSFIELPDGVTAEQITAAKDQLLAMNIKCLTEA